MLARQLSDLINAPKNPEKTELLRKLLEQVAHHNAAVKEAKEARKNLAALGLEPEILLEPHVMTVLNTGDTASMQLLLEYGANLKTFEEGALLKAAAKCEIADCLTLLFNAREVHKTPDILGSTLLVAAESGRLPCVRFLIEQAHVPVDYQTPKPALYTRAFYGETALMYACLAAQIEVAAYLLSKGAQVNLRNSKGGTAFLKVFVRNGLTEKRLECAKLLLSHGADPLMVNKYHKSPLHYSAKCHPTLVRFLLGLGLEVDMIVVKGKIGNDDEGLTPLAIAVAYNQLEAAQALLEHGANANNNCYGKNYLSIASKESKPMTMLLIGSGCDVEHKDGSGNTYIDLIKQKRTTFDHTPEEMKIIMAAVKFKDLDEALTNKRFALAEHLITTIATEAPILLLGYLRQCSNHRKTANALWQDPAYQFAIMKISTLAAKSDPKLFVEICLTVGRDIYVNAQNLDHFSRSMLALHFLMEGKEHERVLEYPIVAALNHVLGIAASDQRKRLDDFIRDFPQQMAMVGRCTMQFTRLFTLTQIAEMPITTCHFITAKMRNAVRNLDPNQIELPEPKKGEIFVDAEGDVHSVHKNPRSHLLLSKLRHYKEQTRGRFGFFSSTSHFEADIPMVIKLLLAIDHSKTTLTREVSRLVNYLNGLEQKPEYEKERAAAANSLPGLLNELKVYLQDISAQPKVRQDPFEL